MTGHYVVTAVWSAKITTGLYYSLSKISRSLTSWGQSLGTTSTSCLNKYSCSIPIHNLAMVPAHPSSTHCQYSTDEVCSNYSMVGTAIKTHLEWVHSNLSMEYPTLRVFDTCYLVGTIRLDVTTHGRYRDEVGGILYKGSLFLPYPTMSNRFILLSFATSCHIRTLAHA